MTQNAWSKFQNDFDSMTDAEVDSVTKEEERNLEQAEEWLEAVSAWAKAGRPRVKTQVEALS